MLIHMHIHPHMNDLNQVWTLVLLTLESSLFLLLSSSKQDGVETQANIMEKLGPICSGDDSKEHLKD